MDENYEVVIPLDGETVRRLAQVGRHLGMHPTRVAAKLLRDILNDSAMVEAGLLEATRLN